MARYFTDQTLEEIRRRIDIVELIGARVTLKRSGAAFKARCPFHNEKTPSFVVNPARRSYHCFGCNAHGDIFKFLMQADGLTFTDAVRTLAARAAVKLDVRTDHEAAAREVLYRLHAELAAFYARCLKTSAEARPARDYLARRRLDGETIERFGIGYAPAEPRDALLRWAAKSGFSPEHLVAGGLLAPPREEGRDDDYYDRFRGRLMFPIRDATGRVIAFSGRVLDPAAHPAKYLNSPDTPIFQKGRVLYALDLARAAIVRGARRWSARGRSMSSAATPAASTPPSPPRARPSPPSTSSCCGATPTALCCSTTATRPAAAPPFAPARFSCRPACRRGWRRLPPARTRTPCCATAAARPSRR